MSVTQSVRTAALAAAAESGMPVDMQEAMLRNGWLDSLIVAAVSQTDDEFERGSDWPDPQTLLPKDLELPVETDRGFVGQVLDVAWPAAYGNHHPPSFWWAVSFGATVADRVRLAREQAAASNAADENKD